MKIKTVILNLLLIAVFASCETKIEEKNEYSVSIFNMPTDEEVWDEILNAHLYYPEIVFAKYIVSKNKIENFNIFNLSNNDLDKVTFSSGKYSPEYFTIVEAIADMGIIQVKNEIWKMTNNEYARYLSCNKDEYERICEIADETERYLSY